MSCLNPISIKSTAVDAKHGDTMFVPCGKCVGCLHDKQLSWIYRIEAESRVNKHQLFVTLTYDTPFLPLLLENGDIERYSDYVKRKSILDCDPTLFPRDMTNYFKRLRKSLSGSIRYYYCGEYGSSEGSTKRPHYHFVIFYNDLNPIQVEYEIQKCWSLGFVSIEPLVYNRIKYVTKYMMKDSEEAAPNDRVIQPYFRCSKAFGVNGFLKDMNHFYHDSSSFDFVVIQDGTRLSVPRYFRRNFLPKQDFDSLTIKFNDDERHEREDAAFRRFCQDYIIEHGTGTFEEINRAYLRFIDYEERNRIRKLQQKRKKDF